ncbi:MAG: DUF2165 family protein [Candidatus Acidiferrales bacterium]
MTLRTAKILLVFGVAFFYTFVVFSNVTDFGPGSNFPFVRHVLMMDTLFSGGRHAWRAVNRPALQILFYIAIVGWETLTMILCWLGAVQLTRAVRAPASEFHRAKRVAIAGLTLSLLMWLVAFLTVAGEWFLMWQSSNWNGQQAAFRMFTVVGIVLLFLVQKDTDDQP